MTTHSASQPTVLEAILQWSVDRPNWQRDALRRIVEKGKLDDMDIAELAVLCIAEHGLSKSADTAIPLERKHLPAKPGSSDSVTLSEIRDVTGVNHLASGQNLTFSTTGLTVVYGDNGSGKSGYARILKRICRTRNPGSEIMGNIYAPPGTPILQNATIEYQVGGKTEAPFLWRDTEGPHSVLSAVGVFDSSCAAIHIGSRNEIAARPFGLDIPDELAEVSKKLDTRLAEERAKLANSRHPIFINPAWKATTPVGKAVAGLTAYSDLTEIRALAQLSVDEQGRMQHLKEDLTLDAAAGARQIRLRAARVQILANELNAIETTLTDASLATIRTAQNDADDARKAATLSAETHFSGQPLSGIGEAAWKKLWESARSYSQTRAYPGRPYPPQEPNVHCLLCQQPLTKDAVDRMQSFEDFVQADTETKALTAEREARETLAPLLTLRLSLKPHSVGLQEVTTDDSRLQKAILRYLASARLRRFTFRGSLGKPAPTLTNPAAKLEEIVRRLETRAAELDKLVDPAERDRWQGELDELEDRQQLAVSLPLVESEHVRLATIAFLEICCKDFGTIAITNLGNKLADDVVTPQLRDRFLDEVISLVSNKVRVEIARVGGRYGSPQYQVRLLAKRDAKVLSVLSEGEQTCIALAAFLTEVATMDHCSALVFDDPVTSLDHRWRKKVAERLVKEGAVRQVIVFTHDLIFANDLHDLAVREKIQQSSRTVGRGAAGTGIVEDGLPWQGKSVEDRLDKLCQRARDAKQLFDDSRDEEYGEEAVAIYNRLRATWERALESIAFAGVVQRHRDYIETKHLRKTVVLADSDCHAFHAGFKKCCDITDAHDPSAGRNGQPPAPSEILKDIQDCADWTESLRSRQKLIA